MNSVPNGIDVRNFVSEKFNCIQGEGDSEDPRMREDLQRGGQMDDVLALKKTESRDRGVEIEAGRKAGTERQTEGLQRVHNSMVTHRECRADVTFYL